MTITAHTPKWTNAEHTAVDLIVQFPWIEGEVPFTATLTDTDYAAAIFNSAAAGEFGMVEEYVAPPPAPVILAPVSPRQIRQALSMVSLRDSVEQAVAVSDRNTQDWWEFSTSYERYNPIVVAMGVSQGVTEEQLDQLWALAASL